jgi:uncharacterized protein DUF6262
MIEHLRAAAADRHQACYQRARKTLDVMIKDSHPINFQAVARRAGISTDFLYNTPELRRLIENHRDGTGPPRRQPTPPPASTTGGAVRALTQQLKELRARHHRETAQLRPAPTVAHGENLEFRRQLDQARLQLPAPPHLAT